MESKNLTAPAEAQNPLNVTDCVCKFPDETIKRALRESCLTLESPFYNFLHFYNATKSYIACNVEVEVEAVFNTLTKNMDFYLILIKEALGFDD